MPNRRTSRAFCPSCGEEVDVFVTLRGGTERAHCSHCGLALEELAEPPRAKHLDTVLIAEDSALLRRTLYDMLIENKLAKRVYTCRDGKEFISSITEEMKEGTRAFLEKRDPRFR